MPLMQCSATQIIVDRSKGVPGPQQYYQKQTSFKVHHQNAQMFTQGSGPVTLYEPGSHATTTKSLKCYLRHSAKPLTKIFAQCLMEASAPRGY